MGLVRFIQFGFQSIEELFAIRSFAPLERSDSACNLLINLRGRVFLAEFASHHKVLDRTADKLLGAGAASLNLISDQPFDLFVQFDAHDDSPLVKLRTRGLT